MRNSRRKLFSISHEDYQKLVRSWEKSNEKENGIVIGDYISSLAINKLKETK